MNEYLNSSYLTAMQKYSDKEIESFPGDPIKSKGGPAWFLGTTLLYRLRDGNAEWAQASNFTEGDHIALSMV